MKKSASVFLITTMLLAGCATSPQSDPAYISDAQYLDYNCKQISAEMQRVSRKIDQKMNTDGTKQLMDTALAAFAISQGYGYADDTDVEMRRLKNQIDVLEQTSIKKQCGLK